jgi:hypothetical protein
MQKVARLLVVLLMAVGALSSAQGFLNALSPGRSQDFQWSVSRHLLKHENPYQLYREYRSGRLENKPFLNSEYPVYPASAEIFLWPVAAVNFDEAKYIWATANVLFAIGSVVLAARMAGTTGLMLLGLLGLFLASTPVRNTIGNGQQGLFSVFFLLLSVNFQQKQKTGLAALCLAMSWLKYTITLPLSLVFIRREWRTTFVIASTVHIGLTLFLAFWIGENPLGVLLAPLMSSEDAASYADMFDVMAIATHIGMPSMVTGVFFGLALFVVAAVLMFESKNDVLADLSLLALVSLVWGYHLQYDYTVLIIPLVYAFKHFQRESTGVSDMLIALGTFLIWYLLRIIDYAVSKFPGNVSIELAHSVVFWVACFTIYIALGCYFTNAWRQRRYRLSVVSGAKPTLISKAAES